VLVFVVVIDYSGGGRDSEKASKEQRIVDECGWALSCLVVVNEWSMCFVFFLGEHSLLMLED
jgi:hypothetical protein